MNRISNLIYLNHNKTSPLDERVQESMLPYLTEKRADESLKTNTRVQLAELIRAKPEELLFTAGTTDSIHKAIKSAYALYKRRGNHLITNLTEHPAVLESYRTLEKEGAEVTYIGVDREGVLDLDALKAAIKPATILVSVMAANNETGVIQPVEKIAEICSEKDIFFFCDASQYVGKLHCDTQDMGISALAFGAHKMYGPEGIGALYVNQKHKELMQTIRKHDTYELSAAQLAGFGKAAEISRQEHWENSAHISKLKNYLEHQILDVEGLRINGSTKNRLYTTSNIQIPDEAKITQLKTQFEFADNLNKTSHVLAAMKLSEKEIKKSVRFSFGKGNTLEEVKLLVKQIMK